MPSENLAIPDVATAQVNKEATINDQVNRLDKAITDTFVKDCSAGGTITITLAEFRSARRFKLTGSPAAGFTFELPDVEREFLLHNTTGQTATVRQTSTPGTTQAVATATIAELYATGTGDSKNILRIT